MGRKPSRKPQDHLPRGLTREELDRLGVSTDVVTAGRAFGFHRDHAYDLAKRGEFPCPVIRAGRRYVVPTAGLRRALGIEDTATAARVG